jgi:hypothetical protein
MSAFIDLSGVVIGNFTVIKRASNSANGRVRWECLCICGREVIMHGSRTALTRKRSCGCRRNIAHGNRRGNYTSPEYQSWRAMRNRCLNPKDKSFKDYGGRDISICDRWGSFTLFLEDMGNRPEGMTLDRRDHEGNYNLENCRWATGSEQAKNRRPRRAIESFSNDSIIKEYQKRFPEIEYGFSVC